MSFRIGSKQLGALRGLEAADTQAVLRQKAWSDRTELALSKARDATGKLRTSVSGYLKTIPSGATGAPALAALEAKANLARAEDDLKLLSKLLQSLQQAVSSNTQRAGLGPLSGYPGRRASNETSDSKLKADVVKAKRGLADVEGELKRLRGSSGTAAASVAGCDVRRVDWKNFDYRDFKLEGGSASEPIEQTSAYVTHTLVDVTYGDVSGDGAPEALVVVRSETAGQGPSVSGLLFLPYRMSKSCAPVLVASDKPIADDPYLSEAKVSVLDGAFRVFDGAQIGVWKLKGDKLTLVEKFVPGD